ncbi:S8 family serine peptidase [Planosporangium thailandense]|uniref:S8 family serine peptidase n=1 Tax=Planosporangium thailandense TaxID=765197 RepID=A0ABX0Y693_9ACTN|nr:S8 family serine peptidase [Planosporangium thailandense]
MLLAVLVGLWVLATVTGGQVIAWGAEQLYAVLAGRDLPRWGWLASSLGSGLLAFVPAVLLAVVPRMPGARAAGRLWARAVVAGTALGLARAAVGVSRHELYLLLLAVVAAVAAGALRLLDRHRTAATDTRQRGADLLGLAAGLAALLPWLAVGALGGVVETLLAVVAAIAVGFLAATVVDGLLTRHGSAWLRVGVGGLVAGVALAALAAGTGASGIALAELLVVAPLGFPAASLYRLSGPRPVGWLVSAAAAGPLALADPQETTLVLGPSDAPRWILTAAAGSLAVGLLTGLGYALSWGRGAAPRRWLAGVVTGVVAIAGMAVYAGVGRPGSYPDRLFVVLRTQADLSGLDAIGDRDERLRATYRRLVDTADRSQASLRGDLRRLHIGYTPYYLVDALEVDGGEAVRDWLLTRPDVSRVLDSPRLRPIPELPPPMRGSSPAPTGPHWNLRLIGADRVWREFGVTGAGVVVGTSDSGVDGSHPALAGRFRGGDDSWYDPWAHTRTPVDHGGHGTHTLATAVGGHDVGVAPGAQWVACVNLERNLGNPARYLDCLQFMLAPFPYGGDPLRDGRPERAPQILTNSWGCTRMEGCDLSALRPAVDALTAAGIFVVAAAGNSGPSCRSVTDPPAPYPGTETVGAVDAAGRLADFSSRGPTPTGAAKPDLVAPGVDVLSALPGGGYGRESGTSMATPHVAGVVALMWSANPRLVGDIPRTREILRATTKPATAPVGSCDGRSDLIGAGLVDAYRAVELARAQG